MKNVLPYLTAATLFVTGCSGAVAPVEKKGPMDEYLSGVKVEPMVVPTSKKTVEACRKGTGADCLKALEEEGK